MTNMLRVIFIAFFLLLPACAGNGASQPYSSSETRALIAYNRAVVLVDVDNGSGSGTFIAPSVVLTNHHVIRNTKNIAITPNGLTLSYKAHVLYSDPALDLALIIVDGYTSHFIAHLADTPVLPYTHVYAIGHPIGLPLLVTDGRWQYRHDTVCDIITTPIFFGNSGGSAVVYNRVRDRMELVGVPNKVYGLSKMMYAHSVCIIPLPVVTQYLNTHLGEG